jgi:hypothetical protein
MPKTTTSWVRTVSTLFFSEYQSLKCRPASAGWFSVYVFGYTPYSIIPKPVVMYPRFFVF